MTRGELLYAALLQATEEGVGINLAKFADLCIEWTTNEAIDKACEWLHSTLYLDYERSIEHRFASLEDLINDFRKSMKD